MIIHVLFCKDPATAHSPGFYTSLCMFKVWSQNLLQSLLWSLWRWSCTNLRFPCSVLQLLLRPFLDSQILRKISLKICFLRDNVIELHTSFFTDSCLSFFHCWVWSLSKILTFSMLLDTVYVSFSVPLLYLVWLSSEPGKNYNAQS